MRACFLGMGLGVECARVFAVWLGVERAREFQV